VAIKEVGGQWAVVSGGWWRCDCCSHESRRGLGFRGLGFSSFFPSVGEGGRKKGTQGAVARIEWL